MMQGEATRSSWFYNKKMRDEIYEQTKGTGSALL